MTIRTLAQGLGVSTSTAHKFTKIGCPLDDLEAAKGWVRDRAQQAPPPNASATANLTEMRRQKLILECQLLSVRLEREQQNTEYLAVSEVLGAVRSFMKFAHINLKLRSDACTENIAAEGNPQRVARMLKALTAEGWASGAAGMAAQCQNSRMSAAIADVIKTEFCGITDEMISGWVREISAS